ncbi:MAG TPA: putative Ig domain-containing protein, partial [Acidimicrobiales bacterium]|nr:putative Ig domain-containing protein [Acidimicrobiales bacterium]
LATATQSETGYSQTLAGTGGTTPFAWTVTTGTLPTGLSLNSATGAITGTVSGSASTQTFTITLTDADGVVATKSLTITVNVSPSITTSSLATATQSETGYSQTLAGTGGTSPNVWSISSGTLPTGLSLNGGTGAITGTVGASATTQTFTVSLTDANGVAATKSLTITVNASPSITTSSLAAATEGQASYSQTLAATGGTGAYTWSVSSGTLPAGLSLNSVTGAITGAVSGSATSQSVTFKVTDANGVAATRTIIMTVNAPPSITTSSLPGATSTGTYNQTVLETGGTPTFTWTITTGSLPAGLSINSATGAITGTVSNTATTQTFTVTLTDANAVIATKSLTITVNAVPSVTTTSLATGTQTETGYSQTLAGTGGTTPYLWSVTSGTLPSGLSLNAGTGAITGTLGASATTQTFTVTLTDADNVIATKSLTITVNAAPNITTASLPGATKLGTYNQTVVATGGTTPNTWSISSGILPSGLSLNSSTGVITGTVSGTAVSETFTVKVTDSLNVVATKSLTITVNGAPSVSTTSLASATQGETGYSQTLAGTGGTTPYAWSITTGVLPTGLSLNSSTGVITGTVSGTATSQTFTVTLTDADNVIATKSLTITVNAAPTITTTTLPGGSKGTTYTGATLSATGGTGAYTWSITSGILPANLTLNSATGAISGNVRNSAVSETFTVTVTDANNVSTSKSLTITVS